MGQPQPTGCRTPSASASRFVPRQCHRKGCAHLFEPQRWNQRYCREPECLRLLHRWQATKRQQRRRNRAEVRRQHADAQRQRRTRQREEARVRQTERSPQASGPPASIDTPVSRAWSRSKKNPGDFCDRPGCFEPRRPSHRAPTRYCGDTCRHASRRVRDRERKWKKRKSHANSTPQEFEHRLPQREPSRVARLEATSQTSNAASGGSSTVRVYRDGRERALSSRETRQEVRQHDREMSTGRRPRSPPSA